MTVKDRQNSGGPLGLPHEAEMITVPKGPAMTQTHTEDGLLPCPFCGVSLGLSGDYNHETGWNFWCHPDRDADCPLAEHKISTGRDMETPHPLEKAIWNTRAATRPATSEAVGWASIDENGDMFDVTLFEDTRDRWRDRLGRTIIPLYIAPPVSPSPVAAERDKIAQAIYETEPFYESGEYIDGFPVSPGGALSWKQACDRDAEFAQDNIMMPITKFAYDAADRVIAALSRPVEASPDTVKALEE